jgi:uncharacterized membrane protein
MYRPSPFRAGNIQKLAYGGAGDGDGDKPAGVDNEPLLNPTEDTPLGTEGIVLERKTWATKWGPCTGHNLIMAGIILVLLIGFLVVVIIRARNIKKHDEVAKLQKDNVFNYNLPEFSIVRSSKMNRYMVLLIVPIISIIAIGVYYALWIMGKLGSDCSYSWLYLYVLGPVLLLMSVLVIVNNVKAYKRARKGLDNIQKRVVAFEKFVKDNIYKYNYNTAANRIERPGVSTNSPQKMYEALPKGTTVDDAINDAVKAALNKEIYLTKNLNDHKLNVTRIMYTLSLYQFMMDDKVEKKRVDALFSLSGVYPRTFTSADCMRTYTHTNIGNMQYIDNVAKYITKYSAIKLDTVSMRELKMKVAKLLHKSR